MRLTLGKAEQGIGDGVPVNWGEGLAGSVAEGAQSITVQVRAASAFVHYFVGKICLLFLSFVHLFLCFQGPHDKSHNLLLPASDFPIPSQGHRSLLC